MTVPGHPVGEHHRDPSRITGQADGLMVGGWVRVFRRTLVEADENQSKARQNPEALSGSSGWQQARNLSFKIARSFKLVPRYAARWDVILAAKRKPARVPVRTKVLTGCRSAKD